MPRVAGAAVPPSATGTTSAVATDQADATRAALSVLAAGGNAVDGAIAAALALGVVNPSASGIGGGGFALVYTAKDKKVSAFDFREAAPTKLDPSKLFPKSKAGGAFEGANGRVVGVPGEPAGLELLSRRFGRKSLSDVAAPAVALAHDGFYASAHLVREVTLERARVEASPALGGWFLPGGVPIGMGARVRRPELAATLARFGAEGKRAIYDGAIGDSIVKAADRAGGAMTAEDLRRYEVKERTPLSRTIDGRTITTMPAPSAGGLTLLEVLTMYGASSRSELQPLGLGSSTYIHLIAEALRGAFADRARISGDPAVEPGVDARYEAALDPAQLALRRKTIDANKTHKPAEFKTREQGTSHLIVADHEGNVVALTTTVNGVFGASIVADGTGVLLNNELEDFTHPDDAAAYALPGGGPNRPRGGARPVSSMTPALVFEGGEPILAVGGSGGTRIATGVTQATLARLVFDLDPNACVSAPRFHTQGAELLVDKDIPLDVQWGLSARGETVKDEVFPTAAVQMVAWRRAPGQPTQLLAASDPRRAGLAAAR
jgi:gamma-glutamyltranspeptidase/glutathione hydrolase